MLINPLSVLAAISALIGFGGMLYGVTGKTDTRRRLGLVLLQGGMTTGGLLMLTNGFVSGTQDDVFAGFLLLMFGTGTTAILPKTPK